MLLTRRQPRAPFADARIIAVRQVQDHVVNPSQFCRRDDEVARRIGFEAGDIAGDGAVQQIDVLRQIKGDEALRAIPVVMLTSSNEERDIVESYALGVNSYLIKPIEFTKLGEQVVNAGLYWLLANKVPS